MTIPRYDHIVLVVEENHNFDQIIGNTASAPFINALASSGALLTNYTAVAHPSEPNYFALYAGSTFGITDDGVYSEADPTLYTVLKSAGRSFAGYVDQNGSSVYRHDPWTSFPEGTSVEVDFTSFPSLFAHGDYSTLPNVSFVIPSLIHDMHDGSVAQGDSWLQANLGDYATWARTHNSLLIVVYDENDGEPANQVTAILAGAHVHSGLYGVAANHYNMLSTILASFGLAAPNNAAGAAPILVFSPSRDLDADGHSDILFRRTSDGVAYLFAMNDATVTSGATLSTQVGNNWQIKGIGDFDGNGTSDILWVYNNPANASDPLNGVSYITLQNGPAAAAGSGVVQQLGPEWSVQGVGDFDGDGKADVLYRRSTDGALYLDAMNGASVDFSKSGFLSQQISDLHWQVAGIGDFDGDGHADILWRYDNPSNPSDGLNGVVYEWLMNGTNVTGEGLISSQPGSDKWQVAGTGDFDGNGTADILFRYENAANAGDALNGFTYLDLMNGTNVSSSSAPTQWQVDNSWSVASIGDYNGDGKSDILFQHAGDGATYIWNMNGTATTSGNFTSMQSGPGWAVQNGMMIG